jgi:hypothetical protein
MLAPELAEAAAQGQSGDAGVGVDSHRRGQAMGLGRCIELAEIEARLGPRGSLCRIDFDLLHPREVDEEATVTCRSAANVMAAGAHGNEQRARTCKLDGCNDIIRAGAVDDCTRAAVNHAIPDSPCLIVGNIAWRDHFATDHLPQPCNIQSLRGRFISLSLRKPITGHRSLLSQSPALSDESSDAA